MIDASGILVDMSNIDAQKHNRKLYNNVRLTRVINPYDSIIVQRDQQHYSISLNTIAGYFFGTIMGISCIKISIPKYNNKTISEIYVVFCNGIALDESHCTMFVSGYIAGIFGYNFFRK